MIAINNPSDLQSRFQNEKLTKAELVKVDVNPLQDNQSNNEDVENNDSSTDFNSSVQPENMNQKNSIKEVNYQIIRIKCQEKVDFNSRFKQIVSLNVDSSLKKQMLQALKQQLQEKLNDQTSFRHIMRKKVSKKQKQPSSVQTKTTAAHSTASTVNNINIINIQNNNILTSKNPSSVSPMSYNPHQLSISNNPQLANILANAIQQNQEDNLVSKRCSIFSVQTQVIYSARKDGQSNFDYKYNNSSRLTEHSTLHKNQSKQNIIKLCQNEEKEIKNIEKSLIPAKNERNRISEVLEDYKDDLIVSKQYLRDITITYDQKHLYLEQLIQKINSMSRSGYTMNNRENNMANMSMLNTTRMNATFVDEAVSKFKAVKDFFKSKIFSNKDNSNQGQLFGASTTRNTGVSSSSNNNNNNQYPMTNRILDFNY
ncbi:hypothetical protein TTHERM_00283660 (macronuclear) [Tetrahymena thermophila SB210]|uniref:Uncharacterized protein n=1 Tax=Tetrahymena thermophila (strain SB210) TaxID=312017 RepID=I7M1X6_TETTS|nr:hypothetical protein TTHERM_00283660 [Tetrahymena thermophila SB210]EAR97977.1 hypothetical protein TTHERM_00283660 [Tetrahymena thermophila SB210]|eukprot:XP_001018222.1 hypothetical protein TTHERM_00283660 [Tetrahymena thermophila SB210]